MSIYEVGYDYAYECVMECNYYYGLEEATKAFKFLEEKAKQLSYTEMHPYIHKCEVKNIFNSCDYNVEGNLNK